MPEQGPSRFEAMKQGFMDAVGSGLEHLQSGIDSLKQNADRLKAIGQITLLGAGAGTGIGLALPNAVGAEGPVVHGSNNPAAEATASDQTQDCVNAALGKPKITFSPMVYPGDRRRQQVSTSARLSPVSSACLPLINREAPQVSFEMQRPKNHKAWVKTKSQELVDPSNNNQPIGNEGGKGSVFVVASGQNRAGVLKQPHFLYRCTPGKGVTHVRAVYKMKVDSAVDGHVVGRKTYSKSVKILPVSLGPPQGGGVKKAC